MDRSETAAAVREDSPPRPSRMAEMTGTVMIGDRERMAATSFAGLMQMQVDPKTLVGALERCRPHSWAQDDDGGVW